MKREKLGLILLGTPLLLGMAAATFGVPYILWDAGWKWTAVGVWLMTVSMIVGGALVGSEVDEP